MVDGKSFVAEEALPWFSTLVSTTADIWKETSDADGTTRVTFNLASEGKPKIEVHPVGSDSKEFSASVNKTIAQLLLNTAVELPKGAESASFDLWLTSDLRKLPRDTIIKLPKDYYRGEDGRFITDSMKFAPGQPFRVAILPDFPPKMSPKAAEFEEISSSLPYLSMSCRLINASTTAERSFKPVAADILKSVRAHWSPPKAIRNDQVRLIAAISPSGTVQEVYAVTKTKLRPSDYAALHAIKDGAPFKPFTIPNLNTAWICLDISGAPRPEEDDFE